MAPNVQRFVHFDDIARAWFMCVLSVPRAGLRWEDAGKAASTSDRPRSFQEIHRQSLAVLDAAGGPPRTDPNAEPLDLLTMNWGEQDPEAAPGPDRGAPAPDEPGWSRFVPDQPTWSGLLLVENDPPSAQPRWKERYAPFAKPGLLRRFSHLKDAADILRFANSYGFLTTEGAFLGETLGLWQHEIRRLRVLLRLWDWFREGNAHALEDFVWWESRDGPVTISVADVDGELVPRVVQRARHGHAITVVDTGGGSVDPWPSRLVISELSDLAHWRCKDVLGPPTRYYLCEQVNERLKGHVTPRVLAFRESDLRFAVDSLLASLYLLFQLELVGVSREAGQVKCARPTCMNYFRPIGNQHFCSPECSDWGGRERRRRWGAQRRKRLSPRS